MNCRTGVTVALACIGLGVLLSRDSSQAREAAKPRLRATASKAREDNLVILQLLDQTIETKVLQEKVPLKVAIEYFADRFVGKLPIIVDKSAFDAVLEDDKNILDQEIYLPPVPAKLRMETVLRAIVSQLAKGKATFVVHSGMIEITTSERAKVENLLRKPILASFDQRPVQDAIDELADLSGLTINVDRRIGDKAKALVSAQLRNATLEDALVTITESADLKFVVMENAVFVSTPELARQIQKEAKEREASRPCDAPSENDGAKGSERGTTILFNGPQQS